MPFNKIEKGMRVYDRWWPDEIIGRVTRKLKTRVYIQLYDREIRYDKAHVQFLERRK